VSARSTLAAAIDFLEEERADLAALRDELRIVELDREAAEAVNGHGGSYPNEQRGPPARPVQYAASATTLAFVGSAGPREV